MRYSVIFAILSVLARVPGAIWCYFVHSWYAWIKLGPHADYDHGCFECERKWGYRASHGEYC